MSPEQTRVEYKDIPVTVNRKIDILFLIDDSPSMAPKQKNLADNFPNFINVLNTVKGGLPDVHIGIATSDMGASSTNGGIGASIGTTGLGGCSGTGRGGKLQVIGAPEVSGNYLIDSASGSGRNFTGDLSTVFSKMAVNVGVGGCGFEQHLEAIKSALDPTSTTGSVAANAGFLRADAYLAVIIIADEDDCSLADAKLLGGGDGSPLGPLQSFRCTRYGITCDVGGATPDEMNIVGAKSQCHSNESGTDLTKVQRYIDFLRGLKADPADVVVALIGGPNTPVQTELRAPTPNAAQIPALAHSCHYIDGQGSDENADPSVRQTQFMNAFPNRFTFTTICNNDLTGGLVQIAQLVVQVFGDACIEGELATPYECSVSDVVDPGKSDQTETILPACTDQTDSDMSPNAPCWLILPDAMDCGSNTEDPDMLALRVKRAGVKPADNTHVIANCVTLVTEGSGGTGSD